MDYILVKTTTDKRDHAEELARMLVERRLAACVQIVGPIRSIYRWQDELCTAEEWQLWIKSHRRCRSLLEQAIRDHHHYQTAEFIVVPVDGSNDFLRWVDSEVFSG